ncbi:hypothetical protein AKJ18_22020 [Vibrio xuii]|nr:hypothetical protein AKJ18_22020 [Vibrio xuii]
MFHFNKTQYLITVAILSSQAAYASSFDYENATTGSTEAAIELADSSEVIRDNSNTMKTGGYISEWAQYDRGFKLEQLSNSSYTDLIYSFFAICGDEGEKAARVKAMCEDLNQPDGSIISLDPWASYQSANAYDPGYPWAEIYDGDLTPSKWAEFNAGNVRGLFGELVRLKTENPSVDIGLSIGGWTLSEPFHRVAADDSMTNHFVNSIIDLLNKFVVNGEPLFSTIDVDWEYPGQGGASGKSDIHDGQNFVNLLSKLRTTLDKNGFEDVQLSSAVGATAEYINYIGANNYSKLGGKNGLLDKIYLMNYDYWGAWDSTLGHQSNLLGRAVDGDIVNSAHQAIEMLSSMGVEKNRIMLGIANYSRGKQGQITVDGVPFSAENVSTSTVYGTWPEGGKPSGVLEGYDLFANIAGSDLKGENGFSLYTDTDNNADYYYNDNTGLYYSIDTPRTAALKSEYAKRYGLRGTFVWNVEQDYKGVIVDTINSTFGHELSGSTSFSVQQIDSLKQTCGVNVSESECHKINDLSTATKVDRLITLNGKETLPNPKLGQRIITTIEESNGVPHKIVTNFYRDENEYTWPYLVAMSINSANIPSISAGEKNATGDVNVVVGSYYRNSVYGPEGTKFSVELVDSVQMVGIETLNGGTLSQQVPLNGDKVLITITEVNGTEHLIEKRFTRDENVYTWPYQIANAINAENIENVRAGEWKYDGAIEVVVGSSYRNNVYGPEGTKVKIELIKS